MKREIVLNYRTVVACPHCGSKPGPEDNACPVCGRNLWGVVLSYPLYRLLRLRYGSHEEFCLAAGPGWDVLKTPARLSKDAYPRQAETLYVLLSDPPPDVAGYEDQLQDLMVELALFDIEVVVDGDDLVVLTGR